MPNAQQYQTGALMAKAIKKTLSDATVGFNFMSPEVKVFQSVDKDEIDISLREMLFPVDLNETGGVAIVQDFGKLARPSVTGLEEGTGFVRHLNKRFNESTLVRLVNKSSAAQVVDNFKFKAMKSVKAINKRVALMWWGSSSGIMALTNTDITAALSQEITLLSAFGVASLGTPGYLADMFVNSDASGNEGDGVAVVLSGVTVLGTGIVTAKNRITGTITIQFEAAPTASVVDGLAIVLNNGIGSTLAQTDFNQALPGWTDCLTVAGLHGITHQEWLPAVYNTSAVRFSPLLWQQGRDEAEMRGDATISHLFWDAAVKRDAWDNRSTLQRFNDTAMFSLDGDIKAKNVTNIVSRFVPPSWVTGFDRSKAARRLQVTPDMPENGTGGLTQDGGKDYIDEAGRVSELNHIIGLQWRNRRATVGWTNKTRS